jgi:hypothetical protein
MHYHTHDRVSDVRHYHSTRDDLETYLQATGPEGVHVARCFNADCPEPDNEDFETSY